MTTAATFGAGSHQDDVARLMGTPVAVREDRARGTMLWRYGRARSRSASPIVIAWTNAGGNLRVQAGSPVAGNGAFVGTAATRTPNAPATLGAALAFHEPSGNGALDGERPRRAARDQESNGFERRGWFTPVFVR